jgi:aminoglycoside phosphotransferase family enzyme/predicted kinase
VQAVELIETHISWILLTGEFAYKIKRPVHYAFIDLRSADRRAFLCHEEIRLNRRFAPELYLGVCPISVAAGEARLGGPGPVIEHAVKMRQFSRTDELAQLLSAADIEPAALESFGRELAQIHAGLPVAQPTQDWGRPTALRRLMLENAADCARAGESLGDTTTWVRPLQTGLGKLLDRALPLLERRFATGRVRECHGDLHVGNIVRRGAHLLAFDCLEFDPALRWIDVADEISFLLADLESRQQPLHAQGFLAGYLTESGDYHACRLLRLFKAHRALVRAEITALRMTHSGGANADIHEARRQYEAYVDCAQRALTPKPPLLVLMCGLSGSGKTWLARELALPLGAVHLRSDIERKRLAGLTPSDRSNAGVEEGLYSPESTRRVYEHLRQCATDALAGEYLTIVDATFGRRDARALFRHLAAQMGIRSCIVHCQASHEVLQARVLERLQREDDPSEANLEVLSWQEARFERPEMHEASAVLEAHTTERTTVERLLHEIKQLSA